jgi:hypothetical protein
VESVDPGVMEYWSVDKVHQPFEITPTLQYFSTPKFNYGKNL